MEKTLATFMKLAATGVIIGTLILGSYYIYVKDMSDDVETYIQSNNAE